QLTTRLEDLQDTSSEAQTRSSLALERRLVDLHRREQESRARGHEALVARFEQGMAGLQRALLAQSGRSGQQLAQAVNDLRQISQATLADHLQRVEQRHAATQQTLHAALADAMQRLNAVVNETMSHASEDLGRRMQGLTRSVDSRLESLGTKVEQRLDEGFQRTTATFSNVLERLALIDEAQRRITQLSENVVSLQEVLADKRSRGAFGEVQLNHLVRNVLPESAFALQKTLGNGRVADCMLLLPPPTGNLCIDSKFPLESYRRMTDLHAPRVERQGAERQFKDDIKKHINDIAERYICAGETADGAVMFIPAEAVFAEIQAHHADLVEIAHRRRVWLVSPTTLMAVLNTARSVIKDQATREQVDLIQHHLGLLAKDFDRFSERLDRLSRHITQAKDDVDRVHVSARKITRRFEQIEQVELESETQAATGPKALETTASGPAGHPNRINMVR
ncbi:MAG: DNA recombination protein RmuC, partial [Gammaproteobacteria bacterium]|nr:DNA recombination protein RmuC [Gammaproteobacteria bacterium]